MGLSVQPPDVNESVYAFRVAGARCIRYGMGAIKGVGASAVEAIIEERVPRGPYENLPDLCRRIDLQRVNRRVFEALIRSGSLDRIGPNRATLAAELDRAMHLGEQNSRAMSVGSSGPVRPEYGFGHAPRGLDRRAAPGRRARDLRAVLERTPHHAL